MGNALAAYPTWWLSLAFDEAGLLSKQVPPKRKPLVGHLSAFLAGLPCEGEQSKQPSSKVGKSRHRHPRRGRLIGTAEVEQGKVEVVKRKKEMREEDERAIGRQGRPLSRFLRVLLRLYPTCRQHFSHTCPAHGQAPEKVDG